MLTTVRERLHAIIDETTVSQMLWYHHTDSYCAEKVSIANKSKYDRYGAIIQMSDWEANVRCHHRSIY
jgi:hypothetical protein